MATTAIVQATVDAELKERASALLAEEGITVDDAVRMLLAQVVNQRGFPLEMRPLDPNIPGAPPWDDIGEGKRFASYDDWFRAEVEEALREADDPNTVWIPHEEVMRRTAERRAKWQAEIQRREKSLEDRLDR